MKRPWLSKISAISAVWAGLAAFAAQATEVVLVGLFPNKAVVSINGADPRILSVGGPAIHGVQLLSTGDQSALVQIDGKRHTLALGHQAGHNRSQGDGRASAVLTADGRGHFLTQGQINGLSVTFVVDTGATTIALSSAQARQLGIAYKQSRMVGVNTANGVTGGWPIKLDKVRVGDIQLYQIEAIVVDNHVGPALLGNSFLNRLEMRREGSTLTLVKRF